MKKYLTPSIEINKFDVEDIITVSGEMHASAATLVGDVKTIYENAALNDFDTTTAGGIIEYEW